MSDKNLDKDNYRNNVDKSILVVKEIRNSLKPTSIGYISIENVLKELETLRNENIKLKEITNLYNSIKSDLPDNAKIIFADPEYFQNGIFKDIDKELETYKKIAEKLAEELSKHIWLNDKDAIIKIYREKVEEDEN